ncbi:methionyl-tRNA formyltransferase [Alkalibaculum bacchi]|uniref:methionyl-tRNA formyltransferase n=1 Tax=Alkalibaculum bacchi TaxID=645887 RepID=UPI0026F1EA42|nr:methionyl-tRNA formyltransferase [Alkalibaculum bacchi]
MKIVFMGTPDFARVPLKSILESDHEVVAVVTQPDKPKGRGNKVIYSSVKELALENNIPILQPNRIKDKEAVNQVKALQPDVIIAVAYGQLLPRELIEFPKYGCINIHASLLPAYRGSAPINWAIIKGEKESGVTTMYMDEGMDTGDIIYQEKVKIEEDMTAGELYDILADLGSSLILKTLDYVEKKIESRTKQEEEKSSYAPMLTKNTGKICWDKSSEEIFNLIRGTNPWPVASTNHEGKRLKIHTSKRYTEELSSDITPGTIIKYVKGRGLLVKTGDGGLFLEEIQFPNKKKMHVDDYLKGNTINMGTILN